MTQVPLAPPPPTKDPNQDRWLYLLWKRLSASGQILWSQLGFSGSNLTDIETRNHADLQNINTASYTHLTSTQASGLTSGSVTALHNHIHNTLSEMDGGDDTGYYHLTEDEYNSITGSSNHEELSYLSGGGFYDHYHLTLVQHTDLTDGGATTLHKHDHSLQDNLNSFSYYHLTQDERADVLGASYLTLTTSTSLTNERTLAVGQGLTKTDAGAGSTLTINQAAFVGDSGSGGLIGAVPAPAAGDGDADTRKFLSADGLWRIPPSSDHNGLFGLEGGVNEGVFETTAFETTVFQQGVVQFYHLTEPDYNYIVNQQTILSTAIDATLDDDAYNCVVTASAKTITLPEATPARLGRTWTIIQNCTGYVDIAADPTDVIILPDGNDTIRLDQIGSALTIRCVSSTQWVIV